MELCGVSLWRRDAGLSLPFSGYRQYLGSFEESGVTRGRGLASALVWRAIDGLKLLENLLTALMRIVCAAMDPGLGELHYLSIHFNEDRHRCNRDRELTVRVSLRSTGNLRTTLREERTAV